jgi:hypothetical protein
VEERYNNEEEERERESTSRRESRQLESIGGIQSSTERAQERSKGEWGSEE